MGLDTPSTRKEIQSSALDADIDKEYECQNTPCQLSGERVDREKMAEEPRELSIRESIVCGQQDEALSGSQDYRGIMTENLPLRHAGEVTKITMPCKTFKRPRSYIRGRMSRNTDQQTTDADDSKQARLVTPGLATCSPSSNVNYNSSGQAMSQDDRERQALARINFLNKKLKAQESASETGYSRKVVTKDDLPGLPMKPEPPAWSYESYSDQSESKLSGLRSYIRATGGDLGESRPDVSHVHHSPQTSAETLTSYLEEVLGNRQPVSQCGHRFDYPSDDGEDSGPERYHGNKQRRRRRKRSAVGGEDSSNRGQGKSHRDSSGERVRRLEIGYYDPPPSYHKTASYCSPRQLDTPAAGDRRDTSKSREMRSTNSSKDRVYSRPERDGTSYSERRQFERKASPAVCIVGNRVSSPLAVRSAETVESDKSFRNRSGSFADPGSEYTRVTKVSHGAAYKPPRRVGTEQKNEVKIKVAGKSNVCNKHAKPQIAKTLTRTKVASHGFNVEDSEAPNSVASARGLLMQSSRACPPQMQSQDMSLAVSPVFSIPNIGDPGFADATEDVDFHTSPGRRLVVQKEKSSARIWSRSKTVDKSDQKGFGFRSEYKVNSADSDEDDSSIGDEDKTICEVKDEIEDSRCESFDDSSLVDTRKGAPNIDGYIIDINYKDGVVTGKNRGGIEILELKPKKGEIDVLSSLISKPGTIGNDENLSQNNEPNEKSETSSVGAPKRTNKNENGMKKRNPQAITAAKQKTETSTSGLSSPKFKASPKSVHSAGKHRNSLVQDKVAVSSKQEANELSDMSTPPRQKARAKKEGSTLRSPPKQSKSPSPKRHQRDTSKSRQQSADTPLAASISPYPSLPNEEAINKRKIEVPVDQDGKARAILLVIRTPPKNPKGDEGRGTYRSPDKRARSTSPSKEKRKSSPVLEQKKTHGEKPVKSSTRRKRGRNLSDAQRNSSKDRRFMNSSDSSMTTSPATKELARGVCDTGGAPDSSRKLSFESYLPKTCSQNGIDQSNLDGAACGDGHKMKDAPVHVSAFCEDTQLSDSDSEDDDEADIKDIDNEDSEVPPVNGTSETSRNHHNQQEKGSRNGLEKSSGSWRDKNYKKSTGASKDIHLCKQVKHTPCIFSRFRPCVHEECNRSVTLQDSGAHSDIFSNTVKEISSSKRRPAVTPGPCKFDRFRPCLHENLEEVLPKSAALTATAKEKATKTSRPPGYKYNNKHLQEKLGYHSPCLYDRYKPCLHEECLGTDDNVRGDVSLLANANKQDAKAKAKEANNDPFKCKFTPYIPCIHDEAIKINKALGRKASVRPEKQKHRPPELTATTGTQENLDVCKFSRFKPCFCTKAIEAAKAETAQALVLSSKNLEQGAPVTDDTTEAKDENNTETGSTTAGDTRGTKTKFSSFTKETREAAKRLKSLTSKFSPPLADSPGLRSGVARSSVSSASVGQGAGDSETGQKGVDGPDAPGGMSLMSRITRAWFSSAQAQVARLGPPPPVMVRPTIHPESALNNGGAQVESSVDQARKNTDTDRDVTSVADASFKTVAGEGGDVTTKKAGRLQPREESRVGDRPYHRHKNYSNHHIDLPEPPDVFHAGQGVYELSLFESRAGDTYDMDTSQLTELQEPSDWTIRAPTGHCSNRKGGACKNKNVADPCRGKHGGTEKHPITRQLVQHGHMIPEDFLMLTSNHYPLTPGAGDSSTTGGASKRFDAGVEVSSADALPVHFSDVSRASREAEGERVYRDNRDRLYPGRAGVTLCHQERHDQAGSGHHLSPAPRHNDSDRRRHHNTEAVRKPVKICDSGSSIGCLSEARDGNSRNHSDIGGSLSYDHTDTEFTTRGDVYANPLTRSHRPRASKTFLPMPDDENPLARKGIRVFKKPPYNIDNCTAASIRIAGKDDNVESGSDCAKDSAADILEESDFGQREVKEEKVVADLPINQEQQAMVVAAAELASYRSLLDTIHKIARLEHEMTDKTSRLGEERDNVNYAEGRSTSGSDASCSSEEDSHTEDPVSRSSSVKENKSSAYGKNRQEKYVTGSSCRHACMGETNSTNCIHIMKNNSDGSCVVSSDEYSSGGSTDLSDEELVKRSQGAHRATDRMQARLVDTFLNSATADCSRNDETRAVLRQGETKEFPCTNSVGKNEAKSGFNCFSGLQPGDSGTSRGEEEDNEDGTDDSDEDDEDDDEDEDDSEDEDETSEEDGGGDTDDADKEGAKEEMNS